MIAHSPILTTIVTAILLAFVFGVVAHRLRLPPIVGFIVAGMVAGPYVSNLGATQILFTQIYDIGLIILMFGAGLHFSVTGLMSVKHIAIPGAIIQLTAAIVLGAALGIGFGWPIAEGMLFGLALSAASAVVLLTALNERRLTETERGRIAMGWLIVQNLVVVVILLLLPVFTTLPSVGTTGLVGGSTFNTLFFIVGKVAMFGLVMVLCGRYIVPWVLARVANTGSRELLRLAVVSIALGFAMGTAYVFGIAFALGAFFAGVILSASELSRRVALGTMPLREAFSALFFIAVGMIFKPASVLDVPWLLLATLGIVVLGRSFAALLIVRLYRYSWTTAFTVAASLAQIGEISLIIAALGMSFHIVTPMVNNLVFACVLISILINPLLLTLFSALGRRLDQNGRAHIDIDQAAVVAQDNMLRNHVIVVGYGSVGHCVVEGLQRIAMPFIVIEHRKELVAQLRVDGMQAVFGNAADRRVLQEANIVMARALIVVIPGAFEAAQVIEHALTLHPKIQIVAYARSDAEAINLNQHGATLTIVGEHEIADAMLAAFTPPAT